MRLWKNKTGSVGLNALPLLLIFALVIAGGQRSLGNRFWQVVAGSAAAQTPANSTQESPSTAVPVIKSMLQATTSTAVWGTSAFIHDGALTRHIGLTDRKALRDGNTVADDISSASHSSSESWLGNAWKSVQALLTIGLGSYGVYGLLMGTASAGALSVILPITTFVFGASLLWSQYHPESFYTVFGPVKDLVRDIARKIGRPLDDGTTENATTPNATITHQGSAWEQLKGFVGLSVGAHGLYCLATGASMGGLLSAVLPVGAVGYGLGLLWSQVHPSSFHRVIDPVWNFAKGVGRSIWSWLTGKPNELAIGVTVGKTPDIRLARLPASEGRGVMRRGLGR